MTRFQAFTLAACLVVFTAILAGCSTYERNGDISLHDAIDAYCTGSSEITQDVAISVIRHYVRIYPKEGVCGDQ